MINKETEKILHILNQWRGALGQINDIETLKAHKAKIVRDLWSRKSPLESIVEDYVNAAKACDEEAVNETLSTMWREYSERMLSIARKNET